VASCERDNQFAMNHRRPTCRHDQTAITQARDSSDGALDLGYLSPAAARAPRAAMRVPRRRAWPAIPAVRW